MKYSPREGSIVLHALYRLVLLGPAAITAEFLDLLSQTLRRDEHLPGYIIPDDLVIHLVQKVQPHHSCPTDPVSLSTLMSEPLLVRGTLHIPCSQGSDTTAGVVNTK